MIIRNPFFLGNAEKIEPASLFLSLYNPGVASNLNADVFRKNAFIRSTPGGGKTSLFRLISPEILREITNNSKEEKYQNIRSFLEEREILYTANGKMSLRYIGVLISCARGYEIIEGLYEDKNASAVFMALINLRIIIATLRSLLTAYGIPASEIGRISFVEVPYELCTFFQGYSNGKVVYDWTAEAEKEILDTINGSESSMQYTALFRSLVALRLITPNPRRGLSRNILIDGNPISAVPMILFDDFHLLTNEQRELLSGRVVTEKSPIPVWFAERIMAPLEEDRKGKVTGGQAGRDYIIIPIERHYINVEKNGPVNGKKLQNVLFERIADCRVQTSYEELLRFRDTLENEDEDRWFEEPLNKLSDDLIKSGIQQQDISNCMKGCSSTKDRALCLRGLKILVDRKRSRGQELEKETYLISRKDISRKDKSAARLYLSVEFGMPYYFGIQNLCMLSSDNVEQFLQICGRIFERYMASDYVAPKRSQSSSRKVSQKVQQKLIIDFANKIFKEIYTQYENGYDIVALLNFIRKLCRMERKRCTASYAGGAYTGIGISYDEMSRCFDDEQYTRLRKAISNALASNYLIGKDIKQGDKHSNKLSWEVLYLNRLFCTLDFLPLSYGGWKKVSLNQLNKEVAF